MALEIKFGTNVRTAVQLILDGEANPFIDFDNVRYSIDISAWHRGMLKWTPFNLTTQIIIGDKIFTYPYAAHNVVAEALLGPSARSYPSFATNTTFPNFPVPLDNGIVTP